jgi:hypothetical protein
MSFSIHASTQSRLSDPSYKNRISSLEEIPQDPFCIYLEPDPRTKDFKFYSEFIKNLHDNINSELKVYKLDVFKIINSSFNSVFEKSLEITRQEIAPATGVLILFFDFVLRYQLYLHSKIEFINNILEIINKNIAEHPDLNPENQEINSRLCPPILKNLQDQFNHFSGQFDVKDLASLVPLVMKFLLLKKQDSSIIHLKHQLIDESQICFESIIHSDPVSSPQNVPTLQPRHVRNLTRELSSNPISPVFDSTPTSPNQTTPIPMESDTPLDLGEKEPLQKEPRTKPLYREIRDGNAARIQFPGQEFFQISLTPQENAQIYIKPEKLVLLLTQLNVSYFSIVKNRSFEHLSKEITRQILNNRSLAPMSLSEIRAIFIILVKFVLSFGTFNDEKSCLTFLQKSYEFLRIDYWLDFLGEFDSTINTETSELFNNKIAFATFWAVSLCFKTLPFTLTKSSSPAEFSIPESYRPLALERLWSDDVPVRSSEERLISGKILFWWYFCYPELCPEFKIKYPLSHKYIVVYLIAERYLTYPLHFFNGNLYKKIRSFIRNFPSSDKIQLYRNQEKRLLANLYRELPKAYKDPSVPENRLTTRNPQQTSNLKSHSTPLSPTQVIIIDEEQEICPPHSDSAEIQRASCLKELLESKSLQDKLLGYRTIVTEQVNQPNAPVFKKLLLEVSERNIQGSECVFDLEQFYKILLFIPSKIYSPFLEKLVVYLILDSKVRNYNLNFSYLRQPELILSDTTNDILNFNKIPILHAQQIHDKVNNSFIELNKIISNIVLKIVPKLNIPVQLTELPASDTQSCPRVRPDQGKEETQIFTFTLPTSSMEKTLTICATQNRVQITCTRHAKSVLMDLTDKPPEASSAPFRDHKLIRSDCFYIFVNEVINRKLSDSRWYLLVTDLIRNFMDVLITKSPFQFDLNKIFPSILNRSFQDRLTTTGEYLMHATALFLNCIDLMVRHGFTYTFDSQFISNDLLDVDSCKLKDELLKKYNDIILSNCYRSNIPNSLNKQSINTLLSVILNMILFYYQESQKSQRSPSSETPEVQPAEKELSELSKVLFSESELLLALSETLPNVQNAVEESNETGAVVLSESDPESLSALSETLPNVQTSVEESMIEEAASSNPIRRNSKRKISDNDETSLAVSSEQNRKTSPEPPRKRNRQKAEIPIPWLPAKLQQILSITGNTQMGTRLDILTLPKKFQEQKLPFAFMSDSEEIRIKIFAARFMEKRIGNPSTGMVIVLTPKDHLDRTKDEILFHLQKAQFSCVFTILLKWETVRPTERETMVLEIAHFICRLSRSPVITSRKSDQIDMVSTLIKKMRQNNLLYDEIKSLFRPLTYYKLSDDEFQDCISRLYDDITHIDVDLDKLIHAIKFFPHECVTIQAYEEFHHRQDSKYDLVFCDQSSGLDQYPSDFVHRILQNECIFSTGICKNGLHDLLNILETIHPDIINKKIKKNIFKVYNNSKKALKSNNLKALIKCFLQIHNTSAWIQKIIFCEGEPTNENPWYQFIFSKPILVSYSFSDLKDHLLLFMDLLIAETESLGINKQQILNKLFNLIDKNSEKIKKVY